MLLYDASGKQICYWRKANAIHNWFVQNVQNGVDDCREHTVTYNDLKNLRDTVEQALDGPESAALYLPCVDGFFFGNTDVTSEFYIHDLEYTQKYIQGILDLYPEDSVFTYRSSW